MVTNIICHIFKTVFNGRKYANTRVYRQTNTKMVADCICFICDAVFTKRKYSVDINRLRLQYFSFKQTFYFILRKKNAKLAFNFSDSYQHQRYCYYSCNFRAYCKEGDSIVLLSSSHHPHHHRIYNDDSDFSQISEKQKKLFLQHSNYQPVSCESR